MTLRRLLILLFAMLLVAAPLFLTAQDTPTLEPPTATFTELPSLTPTYTETPSLTPVPPTETFTETPTFTSTITDTVTITHTPSLTLASTTDLPTLSTTPTASPTVEFVEATVEVTAILEATLSTTPSLTPTETLVATPTLPPTPGAPDYAAWAAEPLQSGAADGDFSAMSGTCTSVVNSTYAIVAPPASGSPRAVDLYTAVGRAHQSGSTLPYPIYLCPGVFPINETLVMGVPITFYGRGVDVSTLGNSPGFTGGLFTVNYGITLTFRNVTVAGGRATGGSLHGGAVRVWSGHVIVESSLFIDNDATYSGGAIGGGTLEVQRSIFTGSDTYQQLGGGFSGGNATVNCARFFVNTAAQRGGALHMAGGTISNSSFLSNNSAVDAANQVNHYYFPGGVDARNNWWQVPPVNPRQVAGNVDVSSPLVTDPTSHYATGDYYNAASPCRMLDPVALPTPPTPTPPPSNTPLPACSAITGDVASMVRTARIRIQPAIYNENWLFELATNLTIPGNASSVQTGKSWLWSFTPSPTSFNVQTIDVIAGIGTVDWISQYAWVQIQIQGTDNTGATRNFTAYVEQRDLRLRCTLGTLPRPTPDPGMPSSSLDLFAAYPPQAVFDNRSSPGIAPAVMGSCRIHYGAQIPCIVDPSQSTIDIVPRNFELCIDTHSTSTLNQCNPRSGTRIPIYAPRGGCANFTASSSTLTLRITRSGSQAECNTVGQNGDLFIKFTHMIKHSTIPNFPGNPLPVPSGYLLGYMCLSSEAYGTCGVATSTTPTHLAYQLTAIISGQQRQAPNDILGYIARPNCLFDVWLSNNGNPQRQPDPLHACP